MTPDCLKPSGLREAKKAQTRSALSDAALELVAQHGYEATTVEAIAQAAGVSVRTFHNYFPGKAAALGQLAADLVAEYESDLCAQPDTVSCAHALRDAWLSMIDRRRDDVTRLMVLIDAIESNPDLRRYLQQIHPGSVAAGAGEVARRLDVDPAKSVVPHAVIAMAFTIPVEVLRLYRSPDSSGRSLDQLLDEAFSAFPMLVAAPPTVSTD